MKKNRLLNSRALAFTLLVLTFSVPASSWATPKYFDPIPASQNVKDTLNSQWGFEDESHREKLFRSIGRGIGRFFNRLICGKVGQTVESTLEVPYNLVHPQRKVGPALYKSVAGTALTPVSIVSQTVSDIASAGKSVAYAKMRTSPRIQVCSWKMPVMPFEHIFFQVDHGEIHNNDFSIYRSQGPLREDVAQVASSAYCFQVPLASNESPSLAIERLSCVSKVDQMDAYGFCSHNCGGMTQELLEQSGLAFPDVSNLGIGQIGSTPDEIRRRFEERKLKCDRYIDRLRQTILELENGIDVNLRHLALVAGKKPQKDALLQLILSAQRGKNAQNIELVDQIFESSFSQFKNYSLLPDEGCTGFCSSQPRVHQMYRKTLKKMLGTLSSEDLDAVGDRHPEIQQIRETLEN